ncbi:LysR substrate-binding domain-containing protein [Jeongeupia naejangsanensis]|uniref:LysR family transcriptional regulator n=1 Tax=Jeongeupia naejangsanensis TaxID=613195 RepID=A0ABS2BGV6_9NEIS|nr:LysR substrate-binding domain-containing protein [Jeongeupia naejangsanensis]MBM3114855.1 LysR family transcriptional regulator [Jeongeupia naejangsanensis]
MSTARLRAFLAVARHGSFSAGARALGLSQPTLTAQVQALERQHGVELFVRRGRSQMLSTVGQQLLPLAQQLSALETEAYNLLHDSGQLVRGQLRLGAVGPFHVIEMVDAYRRSYPGVDVSIRIGNSAAVLADLENYVTDVAVLAGQHDDGRWAHMCYARHPLILFAHVDHPFARRDSVRLAELHRQPLLVREAGSTTRDALERALREAGVQLQVAMEIGSREALREAVIRGLGLGTVSEAEFIAHPQIRPVRIEGDPVYTETFVYCLRERRDSLLVSSFWETALLTGSK